MIKVRIKPKGPTSTSPEAEAIKWPLSLPAVPEGGDYIKSVCGKYRGRVTNRVFCQKMVTIYIDILGLRTS